MQRNKDKLISDVLLWTPTHGCASVDLLSKTSIHQLCEDTGWGLEDLPRMIGTDSEKDSRNSVLSTGLDKDDEDDDIYLYTVKSLSKISYFTYTRQVITKVIFKHIFFNNGQFLKKLI